MYNFTKEYLLNVEIFSLNRLVLMTLTILEYFYNIKLISFIAFLGTLIKNPCYFKKYYAYHMLIISWDIFLHALKSKLVTQRSSLKWLVLVSVQYSNVLDLNFGLLSKKLWKLRKSLKRAQHFPKHGPFWNFFLFSYFYWSFCFFHGLCMETYSSLVFLEIPKVIPKCKESNNILW